MFDSASSLFLRHLIIAKSSMKSALAWRLRQTTLTFEQRPALMGIVNVTPDSFSDGGKYWDPSQAVEHALRLVAEGASILDVGGESTRPYSTPVSAAEEIRRVVPVITQIVARTTTPVSIDTSKASVARAAIEAGAQIINDVTGLTGDPEMLSVALETEAGICAMHMQGTPQTMQDDPRYDDVVVDVLRYLAQRKTVLLEAGIDPARICLDPGIGFGKSHQHNLQLLVGCNRFHELGYPVLVGHSRKGFIGEILGDKTADRDAGTLAVTLWLAQQGIQIIRVHEVARTYQALQIDSWLRQQST